MLHARGVKILLKKTWQENGSVMQNSQILQCLLDVLFLWAQDPACLHGQKRETIVGEGHIALLFVLLSCTSGRSAIQEVRWCCMCWCMWHPTSAFYLTWMGRLWWCLIGIHLLGPDLVVQGWLPSQLQTTRILGAEKAADHLVCDAVHDDPKDNSKPSNGRAGTCKRHQGIHQTAAASPPQTLPALPGTITDTPAFSP